ncbi:hypothetical protein B0H10DRAFT_2206686 [Mycena sp. CBHHK59/15]|nr:hypothetical protein B0H10DRAFT_2206686 [Mycena sp. CBHHK59/15]
MERSGAVAVPAVPVQLFDATLDLAWLLDSRFRFLDRVSALMLISSLSNSPPGIAEREPRKPMLGAFSFASPSPSSVPSSCAPSPATPSRLVARPACSTNAAVDAAVVARRNGTLLSPCFPLGAAAAVIRRWILLLGDSEWDGSIGPFVAAALVLVRQDGERVVAIYPPAPQANAC